jgi:hypothetical protein
VTFNFFSRVRRAHFGWINTIMSPAGLPIFVLLLLNSRLHYRKNRVMWKGREYAPATTMKTGFAAPEHPAGSEEKANTSVSSR